MVRFKVGQIVYVPMFSLDERCTINDKIIVGGQVISSDEDITAIWAKRRKECDGLAKEDYEVVFCATSTVRDNYQDADRLTLEECLENL